VCRRHPNFGSSEKSVGGKSASAVVLACGLDG
jgi:hypothetical protein